MNGIEAWVYALCGEYICGAEVTPTDIKTSTLAIINLNFGYLEHYERLFDGVERSGAKLVGLFEGEVSQLHTEWKKWSNVADRLDLIISINGHTTSFLQSFTSTPVEYVGIPYPVEGIRALSVPIDQRTREILLCVQPLARPMDYLAAKGVGLPMYTYERTFPIRFREVRKHLSIDRNRYLKQAAAMYNDENLTIHPITNIPTFLKRAARSTLWMNLDPRHTWSRYVLDAAALGVPIITTRETWHAGALFPSLIVESPYDIDGARRLAKEVLTDDTLYNATVAHAMSGLEWYRPEAAVGRLIEALG